MKVRPVRLRYHRTRLGLTQADMAALAGIQVQTYRALESGRQPGARATTLGRLVQAFGVPLEEIVWLDDEVHPDDEEPVAEAL